MLQRESIAAENDERLAFLPDVYDSALLGVAARKSVPAKAVYSFERCVELTDEALLETRIVALLREPSVLVMVTNLDRENFWKDQAANRLIVWDSMTPAIVGVTANVAVPARSVVYDREMVMGILLASHRFSKSQGAGDRWNYVHYFFQNSMYDAPLGPGAPLYLRRALSNNS